MLRTILIVALLGVAACGGGGGKPAAPAAGAGAGADVSLEDWCNGLTPPACQRIATCVGAPDMAKSCNESGIPSCLAGRDGAKASGHDRADLDACVALVKSAACEGFAETLAAHTECQAQVE